MIEYDYMDLFLQDSVPKDLIITDGNVTVSGISYSVSNQTVLITNNVIELEQFSITQQISTSEELRFGSCSAAKCEFVMHENIPSIKDKVLKVYMYLNKDASTMLQIGLFKVFEDTLKNDKTKRTITAYDALYDVLNADVTAWYNTLLPNATSTTTISAMRASFFSHFNISVVSTTLANDSMVVGKTIDGEQITGSMILTAICEINGVFGIINNEGKFKFVELSADIDAGLFPSDTLYPANNLYPQDVNSDVDPIGSNHYFALDFEDYRAEAITKLVIRNGGTGSISVGTDGNTYTIEDNVLLYDKTASQLTTIANNLLPKIVNRYYTPATIDCIGNPCHEVGDPIRVNTTYRGIVTYILERHLSGIQALKDEYVAKGVKVYDENLNSISTQIKRINGKVVSLVVDTDHIESRVESIEDGTASVIQQLDHDISLKASAQSVTDLGARVTQAEADIDGAEAAIQLKANASTVSAMNTRLTQAEADIDGAEAAILLKADSTVVSGIEERVTSAEIDIDGLDGDIQLKVSKDSIVGELNTHMGSGISITPNQIAFNSTGSLVIDTTNFSLDSSGNVDISGKFATSSQNLKTEISDGEFVQTVNNGLMKLEITGGNMIASVNNGQRKVGINNSSGLFFISVNNATKSYLGETDGQINGSTILTASNWSQYITNGMSEVY